MIESLNFVPALTRPDLLAEPVRLRLEQHRDAAWFHEVMVAEIDPRFAGGVELCEHYDLDVRHAGNCLVLEARKGSATQPAVCVIEPTTRTDLNGLVRRLLGARRVSLAARDVAVAQSGMEYGSITPVGLPKDWPVLVSAPLATAPTVVMGSGLLKAKLRMPGTALLALTDGVAVQGLAQPSDRYCGGRPLTNALRRPRSDGP